MTAFRGGMKLNGLMWTYSFSFVPWLRGFAILAALVLEATSTLAVNLALDLGLSHQLSLRQLAISELMP